MSNRDINKSLTDFDEITESVLSILLPKVLNDFNNSNEQVSINFDESLAVVQEKVNQLPTTAGLYFFEINLQSFYKDHIDSYIKTKPYTSITNSDKRNYFYTILNILWMSNTERMNSKYPKLIKKRFEYHFKLRPYKNNFENNDWIPLYLGISQNIQERILEHINCDTDTFSMKLSHLSKTAFKEIPMRISISEIPNITLNRRYMIVKEIESILREELHPLVGRQ